MMRENPNQFGVIPDDAPEEKVDTPLHPNDGVDGRDTERRLVQDVVDNPEISHVNPQEDVYSQLRAVEKQRAELQKKLSELQARNSYGADSNQIIDLQNQLLKIHEKERELQKAVELKEKQDSPKDKKQELDQAKKTLDSSYASPEDTIISDPEEWQERGYASNLSEQEEPARLEHKLLSVQHALQELGPGGDPVVIEALEKQERELVTLVNENREKNFDIESAMNKASFVENVSFEELSNQQVNAQGLPTSPETTASQQQELSQEQGPNQTTLNTLVRFGINYDELVEKIPNFASMSEGQQAYILYKAEQQSVEYIQDKSKNLFQEKKRQANWFKRNFNSGAVRREATREANHMHTGLDVYANDIQRLTKHVEDGGWNIHLSEDKKEYVIEYQKIPEGTDPKDPNRVLFENYNRAATALSDIPYEWSLATASKKEQKAFKQALEIFEKNEKGVREAYQDAKDTRGIKYWDDGDILSHMHKLRSEVELNQFFSSYPDVEEKLDAMENASWWSEVKDKVVNPGTSGFGVGVAAGASRWGLRALYGLGGAAGASAIIGGVMGWRKKKGEFTQDSKDVRRGSELKESTKKVFDANKNTARIYKLMDQLEKTNDPARRQRTLTALEDRLKMLDERIKQGRVNFGKSKDQLQNKQELVTAMANAHEYRFAATKEATLVQDRVLQYFDAQDSQTQKVRNKEMAKAVAIGAGLGTATAVAGWLISDYFVRDGDGVREIWNDIVGTEPGGTPGIPDGESVSEIVDGGGKGIGAGKEAWEAVNGVGNPTDFVVSAEASSRGAIQTIVDLREQVSQMYPDISKAPQGVQDFWEASKNPTQYAMDENLYRPNSINESAIIMKGDKLGINKAGHVVFEGSRSGISDLTVGEFGGDHFDSGSSASGSSNVNIEAAQNATKGEKWKEMLDRVYSQKPETGNTNVPPLRPGAENPMVSVNDRPFVASDRDISVGPPPAGSVENVQDNIFAGANPANEITDTSLENVSRAVTENGVPINYEIITSSQGRPELKLHNVDLDAFNAFHGGRHGYLTTDVKSYAQLVANNPTFVAENHISAAQVESDLRRLTNEMIARDQILQEGNLPKTSEEYKLIKQERDLLRSKIKTNFETYSDKKLVKTFIGIHDADPNYVAAA